MKPEEAVSKIKTIILSDTNIPNSEKEQLLAYLSSIENKNSDEIIPKLLSLAQIAEIFYKLFMGGD